MVCGRVIWLEIVAKIRRFRNQPRPRQCLSNRYETDGRFTQICAIGGFCNTVADDCTGGCDGAGRDRSATSRRVRRELVTLPYYGVFDNLAYSINGGNVTLYGQVVRPSTRSDAEAPSEENRGRHARGEQHQVLPLSRFDDRDPRSDLSIDREHGWTSSLLARNEPVVAHRGRSRTRDT